MSTDTLAAPEVTEAAEAPASTAAPLPAGRRKNIIGWAIVALLVLGVALVAVRIGDPTPRIHGGLDPEGRGWNGTMALAELVRDQGVDITVTRSHRAAVEMLAADPQATLVFSDAPALTDESVQELVAASEYTVMLDANAAMLDLFEMGSFAGASSDQRSPRCDWPAFSRVGTIEANRLFEPAEGVIGCFTDGDGNAGVLIAERDSGTLIMLSARRLLGNEDLAQNGNAALGLALLAQNDKLIWYVPSFGDSDREWEDPPTLGELSPSWVTPVILLLILAALAAAFARGRRFGPLVAETLPVTVRASETMHGRARLTAKAADSSHAASALRTGSLSRLARRMGLGEHAAASDISDAVADRLRVPRSSLHDLLQGDLPTTDADLVIFARELDELERALEKLVHSERKMP